MANSILFYPLMRNGLIYHYKLVEAFCQLEVSGLFHLKKNTCWSYENRVDPDQTPLNIVDLI